MKKIFFLPAILLSFFSLVSVAQKNIPEFATFSAEEIALKECPFDPKADAVILLDYATSGYDDDYHLITTYRVRMKILNERAIDRANIVIRYYSKDQFEDISDISAISYTPVANGLPIINYVDKKSIYTENQNALFSAKKFAIPNVKAGTLIEYSYRSVMKNYGGLGDWVFQSDLPVYRSCYNLAVLPISEFAYQVLKDVNLPVILEPKTIQGEIYFEMDNIPGLSFEPYMDAPKDYMQRVEFQLSAYVNSFGSKNKVNQTWRDLAYDLYTDKAFSNAMRKDYTGSGELKQLVMKESTATGKLNIIYNYVRDRFKWNGINSKYVFDGLKQVWDQHTGASGELNLLLVNLLQINDIEAYPMLVAERDFGKVDTKYPFVDRFNKTVAYAVADNNVYILDVTQKYAPATLTPFPLLNTTAFLVDKKKYQLFNIAAGDEKYDNRIKIVARLSEKGLLTGRAEITGKQYARQVNLEKINSNKEAYIRENFENMQEGVMIDSFYINTPPLLADSLQQVVQFHNELVENGGFVLLNYNLFSGLSKNPFVSDIRFTNINFGYPYNVTVEEDIEVPPGSSIDELPKPKKLVMPDKDIIVTRSVVQEGNHLKVLIVFTQSKTLYLSPEYGIIKQFYKLMISMLNEPIVIKLKK